MVLISTIPSPNNNYSRIITQIFELYTIGTQGKKNCANQQVNFVAKTKNKIKPQLL
jgi:hypothetical protein